MAIIVNYKTKTVEGGKPPNVKECQKVIRLKDMDNETDLFLLSQSIIDKYKILHSSKQPEIEQMLEILKSRITILKPAAESDSDKDWLKKQYLEMRNFDPVPPLPTKPNSAILSRSPTVAMVDSYIESLYEDLPEKISATAALLALANTSENVVDLISNESLMSALSRVLREDGRKSIELITNIINIFFCFTKYTKFHSIVMENKVGDMCLRIIEQEQNRFELVVQDLKQLEKQCSKAQHDRSLAHRLNEDQSKFQQLIHSQDHLLYLVFHLLLNLAEDLSIEVKMIKRDIIKHLIQTLATKTTPRLIYLTMTFLKKLSVFKENKDIMMRDKKTLVEELASFLDSDDETLKILSIRLALNLSHSVEFRSEMSKAAGFFKALIQGLDKPGFPIFLGFQLLYQLSLDASNRANLPFKDLIPHILGLVLDTKEDRVSIPAMALAINLSTSIYIAKTIAIDNGLKFLVKKALKAKDTLVFKMVRNISQHDDNTIKTKILNHIDDMIKCLLSSEQNPDLMVEILGILSNLNIPDFKFAKIFQTYNLVPFFTRIMSRALQLSNFKDVNPNPNNTIYENDDILLACIIFLGMVAAEESMPSFIVSSSLLDLVVETIIVKDQDDEMMRQAVYCIYQYLLHETTCFMLVKIPSLVDHLIDMIYDTNQDIAEICEACLQVIGSIDKDWEGKLLRQKFAWHNNAWITKIAGMESEGRAGSRTDYFETETDDTTSELN